MSDDIVIAPPATVGSYLGHKAKAIVHWLWLMSGAAVCLQAAAILLSPLHPFLELANHFAPHGLAVALIAWMWLLLRQRSWRRLGHWGALGLTSATLYLLFLVQPWALYLRGPQAVPTELPHAVKVLCWNVLAGNDSYREIEQLIRQADADVVILIEAAAHQIDHLPGLAVAYPISRKYLEPTGSGICVFSRIPGTKLEFEAFNYSSQPAIVATIPARAMGMTGAPAAIQLVGLHALSPIPVRRAAVRDLQLASLIAWTDAQALPVCVCGDLNTTPWTRAFWDLERAGFRDSRLGVGNAPSWPSGMGWLGIPIDHLLTAGNCHATDRRLLPMAAGSDHRALAFTLHF